MKTKRIVAVILALLLIITFAACNNNDNDNTTPDTTADSTAESTYETEPSSSTASTEPEETSTAYVEGDPDTLEWVPCREYTLDEEQQVKNIILLIGDGMGQNIMKNAEIIKGDKLATSCMPYSCYVSTDSLSGTTDSAAAATAMSCGIKTYNEYIGVDENGEDVETIIEFVKDKGMRTGLVATQIIPHSTLSAMIAHNTDCRQYNDILNDMIESEIDVLFGGGSEYTETIKMQMKLKNTGYTYITNTGRMDYLTSNNPAFGCFAYFDLNATTSPSLTTMTKKALELLDTDDGFFLMVEASHIDIYEEEMDMEKTLMEMQAFDKCIDYTLRWAESHPGTLVLVTADHETGGVIVPESGLPEDINDDCFTSEGNHTSEDVLLFAAGAQAHTLFTDERIENTQIAQIMRDVIERYISEATEETTTS